jgi:hypothetical protein
MTEVEITMSEKDTKVSLIHNIIPTMAVLIRVQLTCATLLLLGGTKSAKK